jgi:hypothetical protein
MSNQQVKVLRSIGTVSGVHHHGTVLDVAEEIADSWVTAGFAEYVGKQAPLELETPEDKLALETAVDGPNETKDKPEGAGEPQDELPSAEVKPKSTRKPSTKK